MSEDAILVGGTAPLSGDASYARGAAAYLALVNRRGGVRGRSIEYRLLDDGDDPARALAATQQLVEADGVFAVFGTVGTASGLAVRPYLASASVPALFPSSGAAAVAGFRPSFRAEGWILGAYLARTRPGTVVGVLHSADAEGRELLAGLRRAVARTRVSVLAGSTVSDLLAAGAEVLALFVPPRDAAAAADEATSLGWAPGLAVAAAAVGTRPWPDGSLSIGWVKDPADPRWRDDEALRSYRSVLRGRGVAQVQGMAAGFELVQVLRGAGAAPTRASLAARLLSLRDAANPFLHPGIVVRTGPTDRFPLEQAVVRRRVGTRWVSVGGVWRHAPR